MKKLFVNSTKTSLLAVAFAAIALTGCGGSSSSDDDDNQQDAVTHSALDVTILHINDHHSHLDADDVDVTIGADEYTVVSGGFPRVVAAFEDLEANATHSNVLKLHAGDAITGTLYYTLFRGEADAAMMNEVCFDAFALGNHEFDDSDEGLKKFLDYLNPAANASCPTTPVLAANIVPQVGTPLAATASDDYIKPYTIKEFNGEKIGIIGIDIKSKTVNSSNPLSTTAFSDETTTAQAQIDALEADGVNKIILLTHYQYSNDKTLAAALDGVDVIVGGDSHTLLGDFDAYGLNSGGDYPTEVTDKSGNKVCVVQAWQYAQVVGELNVSWNADGIVTSCEGTPHLLLGDATEKNGEELDAQGITDAATALTGQTNLKLIAEDATATATLKTFADQVETLQTEKIGDAATNLCLERKPGQGRSDYCTAEETKPHGGDIQTLVAHAFRTMSNTSDIAIQNAGGVRIDVPQGEITIGTAYTLLPFSNTLVELTMTGEEIKTVLEEAVDYSLDPEGSSGAYPYAAGLRWDMDFSQAKGSRLSNIEYKGRDDSTWSTFDTTATYTVVTNNYIAGGKDGYLTFATITGDKYVDTFLDYAQSFVDYVKAEEAAGNDIDKLPYSEYSTQNFTDSEGNTYDSKAE